MSDIVRDNVSKSLANFSLRIYSELIQPEKNLFISPYSIFTALAMAYAGARNLTESEMSNVMYINLDQDVLHPTIKGVMDELLSYKEIELSVANSLWTQTGYKLLEGHLELMDKNYKGSVFEENFASSSAGAAKINAWVAEKTNNRITQVLKETIMQDVKLIIINTIYFKAKWKSQFDKHFTKVEEFKLVSGEKLPISMMHKTTYYDYLDGGVYHAIQIPYKGYETSMIIYLPKDNEGIGFVEKELPNINITEQLTRFAAEKVHLSLPKFKIEAEFKLRMNLMNLGMNQAFTNDADFSGITDHPEGLNITDVIHKTFIEVEEWGTEAAAVTIMPMAPTGPPPTQVQPPIEFRVDHPFVFLIYDSITKSILFMGRVMIPTKALGKVLTDEELMAREVERLKRVISDDNKTAPIRGEIMGELRRILAERQKEKKEPSE